MLLLVEYLEVHESQPKNSHAALCSPSCRDLYYEQYVWCWCELNVQYISTIVLNRQLCFESDVTQPLAMCIECEWIKSLYRVPTQHCRHFYTGTCTTYLTYLRVTSPTHKVMDNDKVGVWITVGVCFGGQKTSIKNRKESISHCVSFHVISQDAVCHTILLLGTNPSNCYPFHSFLYQ